MSKKIFGPALDNKRVGIMEDMCHVSWTRFRFQQAPIGIYERYTFKTFDLESFLSDNGTR